MSQSETQQGSIVFLGRDSFRMQVVDGDGVPGPAWESTTARIIERRAGDRRKALRAPEAAEVLDAPAATPSRNTIIIISFVTFVSGALVATGLDRFRRRPGAERIAKTANVQPATPPAAAQPPTAPAVQAAVAVQPAEPAAAPPTTTPAQPVPAPVILPLPKPAEPEFLLARTAPAPKAETEATEEAPSERRPIVAKATTVPRGPLAPALRPRRTAPAAKRATAPDPFDVTAPKPSSRWVDPFAE